MRNKAQDEDKKRCWMDFIVALYRTSDRCTERIKGRRCLESHDPYILQSRALLEALSQS